MGERRGVIDVDERYVDGVGGVWRGATEGCGGTGM